MERPSAHKLELLQVRYIPLVDSFQVTHLDLADTFTPGFVENASGLGVDGGVNPEALNSGESSTGPLERLGANADDITDPSGRNKVGQNTGAAAGKVNENPSSKTHS